MEAGGRLAGPRHDTCMDDSIVSSCEKCGLQLCTGQGVPPVWMGSSVAVSSTPPRRLFSLSVPFRPCGCGGVLP